MKRLSYKHLTFIAIIAIVIGVVAGCTSAKTNTVTADKTAESYKTVNSEWADKFPNQYKSYSVVKTRDGMTVGHSTMQGKIEAPFMRTPSGQPLRDENGNLAIEGYKWDAKTNTYTIRQPKDSRKFNLYAGCFACKTSKFNDLYSKYGVAAYNMPMDQKAKDFVGGQFWDCKTCHADGPGSEVKATYTYFLNMLGDDGAGKLSPGELACGQCHNGLRYEPIMRKEGDVKKFKAWRYGFDPDALMKTQLEDGLGIVDKETGLITCSVTHPDLEIFQNSVHDSLGMSCVSCHMPQMAAKDGSSYTDHDASQSPLESAEALKYCLTCHKGQGIADADAMVKMVRGVQKKAADKEDTMKVKLKKLKETITKAVKDGSVDDTTLKAMKEAYTKADFYTAYVTGKYAKNGVKVAHNPKATFDILSRAEKLVDDAMQKKE